MGAHGGIRGRVLCVIVVFFSGWMFVGEPGGVGQRRCGYAAFSTAVGCAARDMARVEIWSAMYSASRPTPGSTSDVAAYWN